MARSVTGPGCPARTVTYSTTLPAAGTVTVREPPSTVAPSASTFSGRVTGVPVVFTTCTGTRTTSPARRKGGSTGST